jgi:hypothetical protein
LLLRFAIFEISKLPLVKLNDAPGGNHNVTAVLVVMATRHDTLEKLSWVLDLAAKDID